MVAGEWKSFEVKVTPMVSPSGELRGRVMVLEDLTQLIKAQQLAAWNEAARRIAHEIKNPLTPIRLAAERIRQKHRRGEPDLGEALEAGVEILLGEVEAMQAMVDEFSRYARMPRPQPQKVDLRVLVRETLRLYKGLKPGVEVASEVDPESGELMADPEQLRRVLINLLDNAIEAVDPPGEVRVSATARDGRVALHVADTGRGIPPEAKEKLFLPYFSTKGRGTGLGLAIVHRIVADHRGTIRVEDRQPRGTVFTIELPVR
jgi:two-component system nitrogen regulation sensor histidine kinase NtrY